MLSSVTSRFVLIVALIKDDIASLKTLGIAEVFTPGAPTTEIVDWLRKTVGSAA